MFFHLHHLLLNVIAITSCLGIKPHRTPDLSSRKISLSNDCWLLPQQVAQTGQVSELPASCPYRASL